MEAVEGMHGKSEDISESEGFLNYLLVCCLCTAFVVFFLLIDT